MNNSNLPAKSGKIFALVPNNRAVQRASRALRRKPETLIKNVLKYMTSPIEQALYIEIAGEFHHLPKTFKQILKVIQDSDLRLTDLDEAFDGREWHSARIEEIEPLIEETLLLILRVPNDYEGLRMKASTAATMVIMFGEDAISFIDSTIEDWLEIREVLGFSRFSSQLNVARAAIWFWRHQILPYAKVHGIPDQIRFMDYFEDDYGLLRMHTIRSQKAMMDELEETGEV